MKNSQRPAWMGASRRAPQSVPQPQVSAGPPLQAAAGIGRRPAKTRNRGYDPYDTVNTRFPDGDVWQGKPKRT